MSSGRPLWRPRVVLLGLQACATIISGSLADVSCTTAVEQSQHASALLGADLERRQGWPSQLGQTPARRSANRHASITSTLAESLFAAEFLTHFRQNGGRHWQFLFFDG